MNRPKYLNLLKIRLPLPSVLSILHRLSGVVLIAALPFALAALAMSLASEAGYAKVGSMSDNPLCKLMVLGTVWALFHHLCAGTRFLLLDLHLGVSLAAARFSAVLAFAVSIMLTLAFGVWLW